MEIISHFKKADFFGSVQLNGLCQAPDGTLFASGYIGPSPDVGNLLKIERGGATSRLGNGLKKSFATAFDVSTGTVVVSANDGDTQHSGPSGLFRISLDGTVRTVKCDIRL